MSSFPISTAVSNGVSTWELLTKVDKPSVNCES